MSNLDQMLYRMAYRMAMADGDMSANEMLLLHVLRQSLGLTVEDADGLKDEAERIDYDNLRTIFPEREDQLKLFETACLIAMADGKSEVDEWKLAVKLCGALGIDRDQARECLSNARRQLKQLAVTHNLAPEIKANLEKQGLL